MPLDHICIPVPYDRVNDQVAFLLASLSHMGFKERLRYGPGVVGIGEEDTKHPYFWIVGQDSNRQPIVLAEGQKSIPVHYAFTAQSHEQVDAFHKAALAAGGIDNGAPGPRPHYGPDYYGAFVLDPCGNNVEVVYR